MADVVAEGRGVSGVVLVGVEAAQNVGAEVVVPKHLGEDPANIISQIVSIAGTPSSRVSHLLFSYGQIPPHFGNKRYHSKHGITASLYMYDSTESSSPFAHAPMQEDPVESLSLCQLLVHFRMLTLSRDDGERTSVWTLQSHDVAGSYDSSPSMVKTPRTCQEISSPLSPLSQTLDHQASQR